MGNLLLGLSIALVFIAATSWIFHKAKICSRWCAGFTYTSVLCTCSLFMFYASLFLRHQYQYAAVHQYANSAMPKLLLFASMWSGQSGSLLTWILCLAFLVVFLLRDAQFRSRTLPIILSLLGILLIMLLRSNPFELNPLLPLDGLGLNPVLSHPLLIIHPPFAFMAYAAIAAVYAYAVIAIKEQQFDLILRKMLAYASFAFATLSLTIILGSFWAYEVVGWGGYWSFDPIENGSLIAWLLLAVLFHNAKLYKKGLVSFKLLILSSLFLMFSVIHMVFLIRSGLLSQLSAHAYLPGNLLLILLFTDMLVLILPLGYFLLRYQSFPKPEHSPKAIRHYALMAGTCLMTGIVIVLFFATHVPLFQPLSALYLFQQIAAKLPWIVLVLSLGCLMFALLYHQHAFHAKKTTHLSPEKIILLFFLSLLSVYLFQPSLNIGLFTQKGVYAILFTFLCISSLYAFLYRWHRIPWKLKGSSLLHAAIPLLLLGSLAISIPVTPCWLHLSVNNPVYCQEYKSSFTLQAPFQQAIYSGSKTVYPISVSTKNAQYEAFPALWSYQRDIAEMELFLPDIRHKLASDYHLVPVGQGVFRIKDSQIRYMDHISIYFESSAIRETVNGILQEEFSLVFRNQEKEEKVQLVRWINKERKQLRSDPVYVPMLDHTIQLKTYQNQTLVFTSAAIENHIEMNFYLKPMSLLIRLAYYLIILASLWIVYEHMCRKKNIKRNLHAKN